MNLIRNFIAVVVVLCVVTTIYILVTSSENNHIISSTAVAMYQEVNDMAKHPSHNLTLFSNNFTSQDLHRQFAFFTDSPFDVIVFIHMQKTGGTTFGKNLVTNLDINNPCDCDSQKFVKFRCSCFASDGKRQWLFSRYSTGWMCGLHADFTEWNECLQTTRPDEVEHLHRQRRYLMITMLREPTERYLSEYFHTNRGATWSGATLRCNGRSPTEIELPPCYNETWEGVNLLEFIHCPYNMANNRQTRMLANLSLVNCYDPINHNDATRKALMLSSAMENLKGLAFFGLKEYPNETQYLFEHTFSLKFREPLGALKPHNIHDTKEYYDFLKPELKEKVQINNDLDIKLYDYAKQLFLARYQFTKNWKSKLKSSR